MAFDKDEYWRQRNAAKERSAKGLRPLRKPKPGQGQAYTVHEVQAMQYHKRVEDAVAAGQISKEAAIAELIDASKVAVAGMQEHKMSEIIIAKVELLILHGSYEQAAKAQSEAEHGRDVPPKA